MNDIPEDIMRAAREAVCLHYRKTGVRADAPWLAGISDGGSDDTPDVNSAAIAILAERKRCSEISEHFTGSLWSSRDNEIAAMIMMEINGGKK